LTDPGDGSPGPFVGIGGYGSDTNCVRKFRALSLSVRYATFVA
jgi:hypothetical protein